MLTHGLSVSRETSERLSYYVDELVRWQKRMNLIGPASQEEIWQRHILDTWQVAEMIEPRTRVIDMGSGAGLPGLLIAIHLADVGGGAVSLVEANGKKCSFLNHVRRGLSLPDTVELAVVHDRVQAYMPLVEDVDVITARAFASLADLLDHAWLAPSATGRRHIFPKGRNVQSEIEEAKNRFAFDVRAVESVSSNEGTILEITNLVRL